MVIDVGEEVPGQAAAPAPGGDRKAVSLAVVDHAVWVTPAHPA